MKFGVGTKVQILSKDGISLSGIVVEADDICFYLKTEKDERFSIAWDLEISGECVFRILSTSESLYLKAA